MAWLAGWPFRKAVTYTHADSLTNYAVKILVGESSGATGEEVDCGGLCNSDFSDLRFTSSDGETLLDHWLETTSGTTPNQLATVWVNLPTVDSSGYKLFMYYGNIDAASTSDGPSTFPLLFDHFDGTAVDDTKWTNTGTATTAASVVTVPAVVNNNIQSISTFGGNTAYYARVKTPYWDTAGKNPMMGYRKSSGSGALCTMWNFPNVSNLQMLCQSDGGSNTGVNITAPADDTWVNLQVARNGTATATMTLDGTTVSGSTNIPTTAMEVILRTEGATPAVVEADWILVRNYRATEPAAGTWGSREVDNWLAGWTYRKEITVTGTTAGTDYPIYIAVGESSGATGEEVDCGANCNTDFSDLRFTDEKGDVLAYFVERITGTTPNQLCQVFFLAPTVSTTGTTYYMYYGNSGASSLSDGSSVFTLLYHDFEYGGSGGTASNPPFQPNGGTYGTAYIDTDQYFNGSRSLEFTANDAMKLLNLGTASNVSLTFWARKTDTTSFDFVWGDSNGTIYPKIETDEKLYAYDNGLGSWVDSGLSVTADTWFRLEILDIDWTANTNKFTIDRSAKTAAMGWHNPASYDGYMLIDDRGGVGGGGNFWMDCFYLRQCWVTEPTKAFAAEEGWLTGWDYRNECTFTHALSLTDYQVKVLVGESAGATGEDTDCGAWCNTDFSDIRFTGPDGVTLLDYWIESTSGTTPNQLATIWVELPTIDSGGYKVYMYYGNASAADAASGANTFLMFDDFDGTALDAAIWGTTKEGTGSSFTIGTSVLTLNVNVATDRAKITSLGTWGGATAMRARSAYKEYTAATNNYRYGYINDTPSLKRIHFYANPWSGANTWKYSSCHNGAETYTDIDPTTSETYAIWDMMRGTNTPLNKYSVDGSWLGTHTTNVSGSNLPIVVDVDNDASAAAWWSKVDWVLVRKYQETDPAQGTWEVQYMLQSSGTVSPQVMSYMLMQFAN